MTEEIIIAGFGGQGVLSMGKILAYSGIMQDQEVSWMPSYGPEMRGGTANVTVIISDERISSPVLNAFDSAIVLNQQSMDKFEPLVKAGGTLIYDPNGITHHPTRKESTTEDRTGVCTQGIFLSCGLRQDMSAAVILCRCERVMLPRPCLSRQKICSASFWISPDR